MRCKCTTKYKLKIKIFYSREVRILLENKTDFQSLNTIILSLSQKDIYGGIISENNVLNSVLIYKKHDLPTFLSF